MRHSLVFLSLLAVFLALPAFCQQPAAPSPAPQAPTLQTTVDEVLLDIVVRDKKGKPITDLKPEELTVLDEGAKQGITSFRLVQGKEAVGKAGEKIALDPLRQLRLVTLVFEGLGEPDQRQTARKAALDLITGEQGANVFYSVVMINTRLMILQPFTNDRTALTGAINNATAGVSVSKLTSESESIKSELRRQLGPAAANDTHMLAAAVEASKADTASGPPSDPTKALLMRVMLDMTRMDAAMASVGSRLSITALQSLVQGLQAMPGRKSVLYFTAGMYVTPELDVPFRSLLGQANRANVTFYSLDTRGVMTSSQNQAAASQLRSAAKAAGDTMMRTEGAVSKDEILAADNAEVAARSNVQLFVRDLAESTGGFLIGDSNDLRVPLRQVNEEISSFYEVSYKPEIKEYDGSFRKIKVQAGRKNLVIHARNGYFALPPELRASGMQVFEVPLLKAISDGKISDDVEFRSGAVLLQPRDDGNDVSVLVEVPLRGMQPRIDAAKKTQNVHFSLGALVKDSKGEVVEKITRDRDLQVTADQLKLGNFVEKASIGVAPGKYTLESAVLDRESGKIGMHRSEFSVEPKARGVRISSLTGVRGYTPNAKNLDPNEPFQFQGGTITPTLNTAVPRAADSVLRLFFTVYQDKSIASAPAVEVEFLQQGKSLTKVPLPLPAADAQGRIPYVMSIPAAAIPPGTYEVKATAKQGDTASDSRTTVEIR